MSSKPKRAPLRDIEAAVTRGQSQPRKLPATIPLSRAESVSLIALQNDSVNVAKQRKELDRIAAYKKAA